MTSPPVPLQATAAEPGGHIVDSSDHSERLSPELAALDAAMSATMGMPEWIEISDLEKRARIFCAALEAATPHLAAAERAELENLRHALKEAGKEMDRRYEMGAAAGRERCAQRVDDLADHHDEMDMPGWAWELRKVAALLREAQPHLAAVASAVTRNQLVTALQHPAVTGALAMLDSQGGTPVDLADAILEALREAQS